MTCFEALAFTIIVAVILIIMAGLVVGAASGRTGWLLVSASGVAALGLAYWWWRRP